MTLVHMPVDPMIHLQVNHEVNLVSRGLNLKFDLFLFYRKRLLLLNVPHGININNNASAYCIVASVKLFLDDRHFQNTNKLFMDGR